MAHKLPWGIDRVHTDDHPLSGSAIEMTPWGVAWILLSTSASSFSGNDLVSFLPLGLPCHCYSFFWKMQVRVDTVWWKRWTFGPCFTSDLCLPPLPYFPAYHIEGVGGVLGDPLCTSFTLCSRCWERGYHCRGNANGPSRGAQPPSAPQNGNRVWKVHYGESHSTWSKQPQY